jgi:hypothetical protein
MFCRSSEYTHGNAKLTIGQHRYTLYSIGNEPETMTKECDALRCTPSAHFWGVRVRIFGANGVGMNVLNYKGRFEQKVAYRCLVVSVLHYILLSTIVLFSICFLGKLK